MTVATCSIEGCHGARFARDWCQKHYRRWKRHGDPGKVAPPAARTGCSVDGCEGRHYALGHCSAHYRRLKRGRALDAPIGKRVDGAPLDRFEAYIAKSGECWLWTGTINNHGYGHMSVGGAHVYVHRWSYEHYVGPIPDGFHIDHLCRVTHCANPEHLEAVTQAENSLRGYGAPALNAQKSHCKRGHRLEGETVYVDPRGGRRCRQCRRERDEELYAQVRAAASGHKEAA